MKDGNLNFLWFEKFGITKEGAENANETALERCFACAFKDASRNINYTYSTSAIEKMEKTDRADYQGGKKKLYENVREDVIVKIKELLNNSNTDDFNTWHNKTCKKLIETSKKAKTENDLEIINGEYSYGIAQKILNMTLKYMSIMELWDNKLEKYKKDFHIPVDSYIIRAAKGENVYIAKREDESDTPWSQLDYEEYNDFQKKLREKIQNKSPNKNPLEWENEMWLKIANKQPNE